MKSDKVTAAISTFKKSFDLTLSVETLTAEEKRKVLMYVVNFSIWAGFTNHLTEAIELLGFKDEEVLIFASACIGPRPQMVEKIVKQFCRNTAIARHELAQAARRLIRRAQRSQDDPDELIEAARCVELMKEQIKPHAKGVDWNNESTTLTLFILWELERLSPGSTFKMTCNMTVKYLRNLVQNDADWNWLMANKVRMGGPERK